MIENNHGESHSNDDQAPLPRGSRSSPDGDGDCPRLPHPGRGPDGQLYPISRSTKLERHGTATSEHSSSSKSSYPNRSGSNAAPFPNSPALSTFSKNSSSQSGSSLSSVARLSVDDVLSTGSISLDARAKRARMMHKHAKKSHAVSLSQGRARKHSLQSSGSDERRRKKKRLKQQKGPETGVDNHEMEASTTEQRDAAYSTSPARSGDPSKSTRQHSATSHVLPACSEISEIAFPVANRPGTSSKQQRSNVSEDVDDEPETIELAISNLVSKYNDCIACRKEISPFKVAQALPPILEFIDIHDPKSMNSEDTAKAEQGLVQVFKSVDRVKWEVTNRHSHDEGDQNKEIGLLNTIQIQIWMRMTIWKLEQENGWEFFLKVVSLAGEAVADNGTKRTTGKKKKRKKQKGGKEELSHRESFVKHVKMLAELAPYVLAPSMEFSLWLKDIMTFGFRESLPDFGAEIFEHFEIELAGPISLKRHGTDQPSRSISHSPAAKQEIACNAPAIGDADRSPTRQLLERRAKRQNAYYESLAEDKLETNSLTADDETATLTGSMTCSTTGSMSTVTATSRTSKSSIREKDDTILFKTSVSLTSQTASQTKNPFLKDSARGAYVGSHLSSKLSNITTLFREVKAPPRPIAEKMPSKRPPAATKRKRGGPEQLMGSSIQVSTTAATQRKSNARNSLLRSSTYPGDITGDMQMSQLPTRMRATTINTNHTTAAISEALVEETPTVQRAHVHFRDRNSFASQSVVAETPAMGVAETPLLARPPPAPATRMPKPWKMSGDELRNRYHKKMPSVNETETT